MGMQKKEHQSFLPLRKEAQDEQGKPQYPDGVCGRMQVLQKVQHTYPWQNVPVCPCIFLSEQYSSTQFGQSSSKLNPFSHLIPINPTYNPFSKHFNRRAIWLSI